MIPQRNISRIANMLASSAGRRIPESVIERDYCLAWLLTGLAGHPLREVLAFKGGTALRRCYFADYRFSEDLDFTLIRQIDMIGVRSGLDEIFAAIHNACGLEMAFDREDRDSHQNSYTFYLRYQGPLPAANDVKVDITKNEKLVFPLMDRPILKSYEAFDDLPEGPAVRTYVLPEIAIEKIAALSDRARNEPRDLYDLWYLINHADLRLADLTAELEAKLKFRNRTSAEVADSIEGKRDRLARLWAVRLANQMAELPPFEGVFRSVLRSLKAAGFR
jgi:uncharacterized protein